LIFVKLLIKQKFVDPAAKAREKLSNIYTNQYINHYR